MVDRVVLHCPCVGDKTFIPSAFSPAWSKGGSPRRQMQGHHPRYPVFPPTPSCCSHMAPSPVTLCSRLTRFRSSSQLKLSPWNLRPGSGLSSLPDSASLRKWRCGCRGSVETRMTCGLARRGFFPEFPGCCSRRAEESWAGPLSRFSKAGRFHGVSVSQPGCRRRLRPHVTYVILH